jgi:tetraacyldisaccharide 4'-kinase
MAASHLPAWQRTITTAWERRGPLACLLRPVSWLYRWLVRVRQGLYLSGMRSSWRAPVPVLVVGNVIAGGAGKTPLVIALVEHLRQQGLQPGVISRGYGRRNKDCAEVHAQSRPEEVGDEPLLIFKRTGVPLIVDAQRRQAAQALLRTHPEVNVLISDDGLQHLALERDLEICVFDDRGVGNGWLLPAGPLREPWPRYVDLVLHTGARPAFTGYTSQRALANYALQSDGQRIDLQQLARSGEALIAVAGIANPHNFFDMLRARGLTLHETIALPDHVDYAQWQRPATTPHRLLCTEKDAYKLWAQHPDALAVPLDFAPEPAFFSALDRLLRHTFQASPLSSTHGHPTA